jgi:hypothetical protein
LPALRRGMQRRIRSSSYPSLKYCLYPDRKYFYYLE